MHRFLRMILGGFGFPLFLLACAWTSAQTPIDIAPVVPAAPTPIAFHMPPGYQAEPALVFVLLTADLQNTSIIADREALAAAAKAYPNQRVCVLGVDSGSVERDTNGGEWYAVLGFFCMPPVQGKITSKAVTP